MNIIIDLENRLSHANSQLESYKAQVRGFKEERDEAVDRHEVLTENIGNCMDTIAQQDKEIEGLEEVIKVLSRLLAEEAEDDL